MSRRKLRVVEYDRDFINYEDNNEIRRFIATIEEIYRLARKPENWPAGFLDEKSEKVWRKELNLYFEEIGANSHSNSTKIDFVLNLAIEKLYENSDEARNFGFAEMKRRSEELMEKQRDSQNPLNRIDCLNSSL
ncbi:unnamed protein product [Caenorhabditis angaria]|uniref:Uncharacterized protein n=1 Tax=Caenorhabditis angaria TaxID=860376 RepID=A0A9P1IE29_9PELO|nr:unnamed protein product [Caenorhabditis angaria]